MKFWEGFFSTDKIMVPLITSVVLGVIVFIIALITKKQINDIGLIFIMSVGFIVGNIIKVELLREKRKK